MGPEKTWSLGVCVCRRPLMCVSGWWCVFGVREAISEFFFLREQNQSFLLVSKRQGCCVIRYDLIGCKAVWLWADWIPHVQKSADWSQSSADEELYLGYTLLSYNSEFTVVILFSSSTLPSHLFVNSLTHNFYSICILFFVMEHLSSYGNHEILWLCALPAKVLDYVYYKDLICLQQLVFPLLSFYSHHSRLFFSCMFHWY